MDFTHDVLLHPFADAAVLGTHEQSVFYQTAKLRAFLVHNTEYLVLKEKIHVCGVFHIRGDSYIFHIFTVGMIITVAVWVGSYALVRLVIFGKKSHTGFYFRHGFIGILGRLITSSVPFFRSGEFPLLLFFSQLRFGFLCCRLFRFLHLLYPLSQTFVPFLIFFLVSGFGKSVLVGEVHVCEVPQELGCVIVSVAALTEGVDDEIAFDDRPLCIRQFGYNFHPLFLVQRYRLVFDAAKRIMLPLQFGQSSRWRVV